MAVRALLGFAALVGFIALGAWVSHQRTTGQPVARLLAGKVHWAVGVMAVAVLALLAVTAIGLLTG